MQKPLFYAIALGLFGTACASTGTEHVRRFDKGLYVRAQEPELASLDPALQHCAGEQGALTVKWKIAPDGHVEDVAIAESAGYSEHTLNCVRAEAYKAQFTAPADHKSLVVSRDVGRTFVAADSSEL